MSIPRNQFPRNVIVIFTIWIIVCNISAIILTLFVMDNDWVVGGIVIGINILSLLLLLPLKKLDPVKPFLIPALIWYVAVTVVYVVLAFYLALIPGTIQLCADLWFHLKFYQMVKKKA